MGNQFPAFYKNRDALVAAYLINPQVVTDSQTRYLDVDSRFGSDYGRVIPLDRTAIPAATPVQVITGLDREAALGWYSKALTSTR
jgi:inosine-uridine nucleoside N-ribohydrolase